MRVSARPQRHRNLAIDSSFPLLSAPFPLGAVVRVVAELVPRAAEPPRGVAALLPLAASSGASMPLVVLVGFVSCGASTASIATAAAAL